MDDSQSKSHRTSQNKDIKTVCIIQARMGSTRLPGKMMLPLNGTPAIRQVIDRVKQAVELDDVVLATTNKDRDTLLANQAHEAGIGVHRGDEADVLGRTLDAANESNANVIVRIAGDCVFTSPSIIDHAIRRLRETDADYASNKLTRTFPLGLDVEAFTWESFQSVDIAASEPRDREHVTLYYTEHPDQFSCVNFTSEEIFSSEDHQCRTDVELVLDESSDYELLKTLYSRVSSAHPPVTEVIDIFDESSLSGIVSDVDRTGDTAENNEGDSC